jgi:hypothetical protein
MRSHRLASLPCAVAVVAAAAASVAFALSGCSGLIGANFDGLHPATDSGAGSGEASPDDTGTQPEGGCTYAIPAACGAVSPNDFSPPTSESALAALIVGTWLNCSSSIFAGAVSNPDDVGVVVRSDGTWQKIGASSSGELVLLIGDTDGGTWSTYPGGLGPMFLFGSNTGGLAAAPQFADGGQRLFVTTSAGGNQAYLARTSCTPWGTGNDNPEAGPDTGPDVWEGPDTGPDVWQAPDTGPDVWQLPETSLTDQSPQAPPVYKLVQAKSLASPLGNTVGITYDGQELWVLSASWNDSTGTLVRFNPDTLQTDRTFSVNNLFSTLGTGASGITWDGKDIWIVVRGNTNQFVIVDPTTGQTVRTMSSPAQDGPPDLDFDGTNIWLSSGEGTVFKLDPTSGGILEQFPVPADDEGIAVRTGEAWVGHYGGGIGVYSPTSGALLGSAVHPDLSPFGGDEVGPSVFVGAQLVIASSLGITYYDTVKLP